MKILFDHGTPAPLRAHLADHEIATAYDKGWSDLQNGDLLLAAEREFASFITTDKNLRYQQNLAGRSLAIQVLPTTSWPQLQQHIPEIARAVAALKSGDYVELKFELPP
jgi:hypothetical protein